MKTLPAIAMVLFILLCAACSGRNETGERKPNILLLLADDLGYGELGCYGQRTIQTPVLDRLAAGGMRFTDFYAGSSVCAPSRAVLMTGKHTGHVSIRGNNGILASRRWERIPLEKNEKTIGELLKEAGYQTAFIGKWHLDDPNDLSTWAINRGFDYAVQEQWPARSGGRKFDDLVHWIQGMQSSVRYDQEQYDCIDEFRTDFALAYLDQRDKSKPFLLVMSYRSPHAAEKYTRNKELYADRGFEETERIHAARITLLDAQIGRLLQKLEDTGELDNTVVFFTSDNGPHGEGGHDYNFFDSSGGLRGYKRDLFEGGIRVPLIASWKGRIQPGTVSRHAAALCDFMPTAAEIAGASPPEGCDGISILPELLGRKQPQHDHLYWELQLEVDRRAPDGGFRQAVRMGQWKGVRYGTRSPIMLFDLSSDVLETSNVAGSHPDVVEKIAGLFATARTAANHFPYGGTRP